MKNRRYFLQQGAFATIALLALKPFKTIASVGSTFTGLSNSYGKLAFLHTVNLKPKNVYKVIQHIKTIKNYNASTILLNAGQDMQDETGSLSYDAYFNGGNDFSAITGNYKIITKGNLRTGIISAASEEKDIIQKINSLTTYLKKEKSCAVVICLSGLGYKNKNTPDDITLAKESTDLDIIIGGHAENFHLLPTIVLNRNSSEVIIHAAGDTKAFGNIEIDFDAQGRKQHINFAN